MVLALVLTGSVAVTIAATFTRSTIPLSVDSVVTRIEQLDEGKGSSLCRIGIEGRSIISDCAVATQLHVNDGVYKNRWTDELRTVGGSISVTPSNEATDALFLAPVFLFAFLLLLWRPPARVAGTEV